MSQMISAPVATAPTAQGVGPGLPATATQRVATTTSAPQPSGVPEALVRRRLVATGIALLAAALLLLQLLLTWQATNAAAANAEQLVRAQAIKVNLLRADALATNAFLLSGLEPTAQRAAYDAAVAKVTRDIADAAQAQPADRAVLAALNEQVLTYASSMELARANNRQGFPIGAAYLNDASTSLRATALPLVDALVAANQSRAKDSMDAPKWWLVVLPGIAGLAVLYLVNSWVAARFKRRINVGLAVAAAALVIATVAGLWVTTRQSSENAKLTAGGYRTLVAGATARSAANDARANEGLRLIARGSGAQFEKAFAKASETVTNETAISSLSDAGQQWKAYAAAHAKIVAQDNAGNWDQAVTAATATGPGSATEAFAKADESLRLAVDTAGKETTDTLRGGVAWFLLAAALAAIAGAVAAVASWRGVSRRLEEYL